MNGVNRFVLPMPHKIEITLPRRHWWRPWRKTYRRDLPASWMEVRPSRRLPLFSILFSYADVPGRLKALARLLDLPKQIFLGLSDEDIAALLDAADWLNLQPDPEPRLPHFEHKGVRYYAPLSHGLNLVALEYPIADEAFGNFVRTGDMSTLTLLCGTLYREANPDEDAVAQRGDIRIPLRSRWEAEARAKKFSDLPHAVMTAVSIYFAGVKIYVHQAYGKYLFDEPEPDQHGQPLAPETTPSLGWWGVYFNLATEGPFGRNVEEVYQTAFHDVCLFLVDRKRQDERRAIQERMNQPDFGIQQ